MDLNKQRYTDFYADDDEAAVRGVLLFQNIPQLISERVSNEIRVDTPVSKWCSRFPRNVTAPNKPSDPMYVFSKWSLVCKADDVAEIANVLLDGVEAVFTKKCDVSTNLSKCKIAIQTSCGLVVKIKLFTIPDETGSYMVMFRKDAGDWFAFSSLFNSCVKFIENRGISFTR